MSTFDLFAKFHDIASNPEQLKNRYLSEGKKVVLVTYYTPEEIIHSMGMIPMAAYGGDLTVNNAKQYFPAFICSILQTTLELGMKGAYEGASAFVIPSLCDSLKCLGENWKYAVPSIPFIPMTYPQNRKPEYGKAYTKAGYERVIADLEKATGIKFEDAKLADSIRVYNDHNQLMRAFAEVVAQHPEISAQQRSDVFKSATFMRKEEHAIMVKELIESLKGDAAGEVKTKVYVSGILADAPSLLQILDENKLQIVGDDIFTQSRLYRTDSKEDVTNLDALSTKFQSMDNCSLLYDVDKKRIDLIVNEAKRLEAKGVVLVLTKFCDPEEFDNPMIKKKCDEVGLPCIVVEVDRQMTNYEQTRTMIETFAEVL